MEMEGQATKINVPTKAMVRDSDKRGSIDSRVFTFDHSFWSHDPDDTVYHTQEHVYV